MQKVDLDLLRKTLGKFTLNGKEYVVQEPTLKQILSHYRRSQEIVSELDHIDDDDPEKLEKFWEWRKEQVTIYIPELTLEEVEDLTTAQVDALLDLVEGSISEEEGKKNKKPLQAKRGKQ